MEPESGRAGQDVGNNSEIMVSAGRETSVTGSRHIGICHIGAWVEEEKKQGEESEAEIIYEGRKIHWLSA